MNTTDDTVKNNSSPPSKDYDEGADTARSDHDLGENKINSDTPESDEDYVVVGRFMSSSRYDTNQSTSNPFYDEEDDW